MKNIENIKHFKNLRYYNDGKELTKEECESRGLSYDNWESLEEAAYDTVYKLSNDWAKEEPTWDDVKMAYKMGVDDGIKYGTGLANNIFKQMAKGTNLFKENEN